MAITRCPYCHAIIDENDKYCNNCGTQLLFPEDDEVDEEIPGEKIIDAEVEEKDYTVDEPEGEKRPSAAKDAEADLDEELEEEMREEAAEKALDELVTKEEPEEEAEGATEEVILVDEIEASEAGAKGGTGDLEEKAEPLRKDEASEKGEAAGGGDEDEKEEDDAEPDKEDDEEDGKGKKEKGKEDEAEEETGEGEDEGDGTEEERVEKTGDAGTVALKEETAGSVKPAEEAAPDAEEEPAIEYLTGPAEEEGTDDFAAATAGESALRPVTFDTKELESLGRTVDLSKEKIDRFIQSMAEKKPAAAPAPTPAPEPGGTPETGRESTGSLPPWASTMKGAPVFSPDTKSVEPQKMAAGTPSTEDEVEIFPRRKPPDSTMGLPERVSQAPLPFSREEPEEEAGAEEEALPSPGGPEPERPARPPVMPVREPGRIEAAILDEAEEPAERPPFSFAVFFKSKAFDLLFVGLFWLVALWLAAHATDRTLFEILGEVSGPMLLLYAAFVLLYFFLFKFFLGETLGDRLFRPRD